RGSATGTGCPGGSIMARVRTLAIVAVAAAAVAAGVTSAVSGGSDPGRAGPATTGAGVAFPLHTSGASIVDSHGHRVKLDMVSWYGAESTGYVVGGLAYQPISKIIDRIVSMGFNGVRLPWSNQMWQSDPPVRATYLAANPQFKGERARTIFEQVTRDLAAAGLMVVLDDHTSNAEWCCSNGDGNTLWYNSSYPQRAWLADWKSMAAEFKDVPQVIGVDLRNEPRGTASWGGPAPADWQAAAVAGGDAVQSVDPHLLIFVEGVANAGDLSGVASLPVDLTVAGHVVYEAHDYGFWQSESDSYDAWVARIQPKWGYLAGRYPLWVGEFGTCNTSATCVASSSPSLGLWFGYLTRFLAYHDVNWSYWAVNGTQSPGRGRTYGVREPYGVFNTAWTGPANPGLLSALQGIQPACQPGPLASGTYYIANARTHQVIDIPGFSAANGAGLDQWPLNHGANQRWKVTARGCGLYSITSVLNGQAMEVAGQSTANGAGVDEWSYWGGGNQQFIIGCNVTGSCTIASLNSLDDLEVPGSSMKPGTLLDQWDGNGGTNQEWRFEKVSSA
ncbi:MAG TPA: cellulase family glycosylhydrolase, partial [Streptosporangiaceae bacterium]